MSDAPIQLPLEDVVIGTLKQLRDVHDEFRLRQIWRETEGQSLEMRVSKLLLSNGPEYQIIINTVRALQHDS